MDTAITAEHRKRFEEIKRNLMILGNKESSFLKIELLFFEALGIARQYGEDPSENSLLASLKHLQQEEYQQSRTATKKVAQRELLIRKFVVQLKRVLSVPQQSLSRSSASS